MRVMITKNMGIKRLDERNLIVFKEVTRKKDTVDEYKDDSVVGYHPTIETAIRSVQRHSQDDLKANSINELINELKALRECIHDSMKGLNL